MAYAAVAQARRLSSHLPADAGPPPSRPSLGSKFWAWLADIDRRRTDAAVARVIQARGGRLTDSLEREIERVLGGRL